MNKTSICPCCLESHEIKKKHFKETSIFKNESIEYNAVYYYCEKADEIYEDEELMSLNDISLKNSYRSKVGLLTSYEIADIRKKYAISQNDLCTLLGWGGKTITRYESHQVQDKAHDSILRKLDKDPEWFLELLRQAKHSLSKSSYSKCEKAGAILFESFHDHYLKYAILSKYAQYINDEKANGNKILSLDVVTDMINYYANSSKITDLNLTKLMRLLWYADNISYKQYGHAISGLVYRSVPFGTEPIAYETIIDLNSIKIEVFHKNEGTGYRFLPTTKPKYINLTANDKEILESVIDKYGIGISETNEDNMLKEEAQNDESSPDIILYN